MSSTGAEAVAEFLAAAACKAAFSTGYFCSKYFLAVATFM